MDSLKKMPYTVPSDQDHSLFNKPIYDDNTTMSETIDSIISNYSIDQLNDLIQKAEEEKERKKSSEIVALRSQMVAMAGKLGMKVEDIISYESQKKKTSGKPKYRNPANPEQTWTGRGKKPGWLKQALESGAKLEDFAIPE